MVLIEAFRTIQFQQFKLCKISVLLSTAHFPSYVLALGPDHMAFGHGGSHLVSMVSHLAKCSSLQTTKLSTQLINCPKSQCPEEAVGSILQVENFWHHLMFSLCGKVRDKAAVSNKPFIPDARGHICLCTNTCPVLPRGITTNIPNGICRQEYITRIILCFVQKWMLSQNPMKKSVSQPQWLQLIINPSFTFYIYIYIYIYMHLRLAIEMVLFICIHTFHSTLFCERTAAILFHNKRRKTQQIR